MSDSPRRRPGTEARRRRPAQPASVDRPKTASPDRRRLPRSGPAPDDRFCRYLVTSMRNGVIAFRRDGTIALMNEEAYRMFNLTRGADGDVGRPFSDVLRDWPAVIRVLSSA